MRWSEVRVFQTTGNRRSWERGREFVAVTPIGDREPLELLVGRPSTASVVVSAATDLAAGEAFGSHDTGSSAVTSTDPPPTPAIPAGDDEIGEPSAGQIEARRDRRLVQLARSPSP